ncbi:MAG: hypothetical protein KF690_05830 [Bacteroidetes bacterium]|nr:hypothetical protein [Bacteroidota bacterium]
MSSAIKIKHLGNFRIWEPIILIPFAGVSGLYRIHYDGAGIFGMEEQSLSQGDALLFSNLQRLQGEFTFTITCPDGSTFTDAEGYSRFQAKIA